MDADHIKNLRAKYKSRKRGGSSGWREVRNGVFDGWAVGRIVSTNGTILYPPLTINRNAWRSVPVHTGVSVKPGDTPQSIIRTYIDAFPEYLGQYRPDQLRLQVQD